MRESEQTQNVLEEEEEGEEAHLAFQSKKNMSGRPYSSPNWGGRGKTSTP